MCSFMVHAARSAGFQPRGSTGPERIPPVRSRFIDQLRFVILPFDRKKKRQQRDRLRPSLAL
jgi:hypothetical protein